MFKKYWISSSALIIVLIFGLQVLFAPSVSAQSIENTADKLGAGSGSSSNDSNSGGTTALYILGGAVLVGLLVWKVISDKNKEKEKQTEPQDSVKQKTVALNFRQSLNKYDLKQEIAKAEEKIPVKLYVGIRRESYTLPENSVILGVSYSF